MTREEAGAMKRDFKNLPMKTQEEMFGFAIEGLVAESEANVELERINRDLYRDLLGKQRPKFLGLF